MAGGVGFIRVKLLQVEKGSSMESNTEMFDPYVAVNVKESVETPGNFWELVQTSGNYWELGQASVNYWELVQTPGII